jgi:hypothetical protein
VASLPFHDAELIALKTLPRSDGFVTLEVDIGLHPDESLKQHLNVDWRNVQLRLENCWLVKITMIGSGSGPQTLYDWLLQSDSSEILSLRSAGLAGGVTLVHHKIAFTSGSRFDVIASGAVSIENCAQ